MFKALIVSHLGLVWQFVLVAILVGREQRTLRWSTVREALWLRSPRSPRSGRVGGRIWLILIPLILAVTAEGADPDVRSSREPGPRHARRVGRRPGVPGRRLGLVRPLRNVRVHNTVLGEELLFRGYLPRMNGAFGRGDWVANGLLFTGYHLHVPWAMTLLDMFTLAYPTKRYRSAWIGIAVHSAQSVFFALLILLIVL